MKFYKAAAQQEVRRLNLKFYPAQVGGAKCLNRANLAADTARGKILAQRNFLDGLNLTRRSGMKI
ncbi:MAG: hypothetical protein ACLVCW_07915 [Campylobacter sp.]